MAQLLTVRLNKSDQQPLGFRLQGGKDFGTPLVVQKVNGGSAAERAGLQAGDALIRVNTTDVYTLRHQEAQDTIRAAGPALELTVQRGGSTWRPSVTPTGSLPRPGSRPLGASPVPVTATSLKATPQPSRAFGSGHNNVAKPFGYMNGNDSVKSIVNKQYNTPVNMYSDKTIAETLSAQTEVLAGGVLGVNFKKNEKTYDAEKSAVFKVLQEEENDPEPAEVAAISTTPVSGLRHVSAPVARPDAPINNTGGLPPGQNICEECERLITGVFVRIKDKNLHVECFKCSTCGTSLKNQGYYNINGKLYCDIHAKLVARQNPPAANLEPLTVPPGARIPANSYTTPLPPLTTNNYTNGSSAMFSPSSNLSGPKPFGSSIGSAYSPSLSPRSAPVSPARPVTAPTSAPPAAPFAPNQNVKSIVWPPPNPPEDDISTQETTKVSQNTAPSGLLTTVPTESLLLQMSNPSTAQTINEKLKSLNQVSSTTQSSTEFTSNVSFSSASMSKAIAASSTSESKVESNKSQKTQQSSTCTVQSYSEQASSESQSFAVYQSSLNPEQIKNSIVSQSDVKMEEQTSLKTSQQNQTIQSQETVVSEEVTKENKKIDCSQDNVNTYNKNANTTLSQQENLLKNVEEHNTNTTIQGPDKYASENFDKDSSSNEMRQDPKLKSNPYNTSSLIDALTTAPDRPYSPLPQPIIPAINTSSVSYTPEKIPEMITADSKKPDIGIVEPTQKLTFKKPDRPISPIPPIKTYNPPEKKDVPITLPTESTPYIPKDFEINIEPKSPTIKGSMMTDALTTAPNRPFTPVKHFSVERGSLKDALTIAPDRPFTPLAFGLNEQSISNTKVIETQNSNEIFRPVATQNFSQTSMDRNTETYLKQSTEKSSTFQTCLETSAFKPIAKQMLPSSQINEYPNQTSLTLTNRQLSSTNSQQIQQYSYGKRETTQSTNGLNTQIFSSVKSAQNFFEQLDKRETLSSTAVRSKSGLHRPDSIPPYQQNFELLPSQRGITPELCNAPAIPQRPVTPTTEPPTKHREKSLEPKPQETQAPVQSSHYATVPKIKAPVELTPKIPYKSKDTPITMTFQPLTDESMSRVSPIRSRPNTPSLINKPAPIIPHYQMNLVTVEHLAPETYTYKPSSDEGSRSPTPKPRSRSPAPGPSGLKVQAPRVKTPSTDLSCQSQPIITQAISSRSHLNSANSIYKSQDQPLIIKEEKLSNIGCQSERYQQRDMSVKEDSMFKQNYAQRQMESQNVSEYGNTTVQRTQKTFEEFERTQSAKVIEIRKGGSQPSSYQQIESNIQPSYINSKDVYPSQPISSMALPIQNMCSKTTNKKAGTSITQSEMYQPTPLISGANQGPVCDPTPSTGSSVGASGRGKSFGVSTAPRRGRGVLNKAALPGSRVPLCGSCNGNIRGPFITALGRIWCPEHFICVNTTCRRPLQDIGFVEENGQLYCEYCFEQYIAPACDKCHGKIKGDCLNAIGKHYHPECFLCVYCNKMFGNNTFFLEDGLPYCEADWNELFTTKCFACGFPVEAGDRWVEALNNNYHSQCFNCTVCKKNLEGQSFFARGGRPFCKAHAR